MITITPPIIFSKEVAQNRPPTPPQRAWEGANEIRRRERDRPIPRDFLGPEPRASPIRRYGMVALRSKQGASRDRQTSDDNQPRRSGAVAHWLFCGCSLFHRGSFDFGLLALFIGFVQEPIDDARVVLLLGSSVLCFLLLFSTA